MVRVRLKVLLTRLPLGVLHAFDEHLYVSGYQEATTVLDISTQARSYVTFYDVALLAECSFFASPYRGLFVPSRRRHRKRPTLSLITFFFDLSHYHNINIYIYIYEYVCACML